ncbi:hypothetical protein B0H21DRAFT_744238 [Amylocystis lapponica]|nr:hypothetical protein B0H21DRAFT_744238 [Amylocystis lapponica]
MSALQTPPRRLQLSTSKLEFETPPPPKGMPDLPGPPSSSDDEAEQTPIAIEPNMTTLKTPRPPGAWADTPAPRRTTGRDPVVRAQSTPPDAPDSSAGSVLATPGTRSRANTLPRANSLPPQTPAPPGAWMATPGTARRKSILKVRFDVESEVASSDGGKDHFPGALPEPASTPPAVKIEPDALPGLQNGGAEGPSTPPRAEARAPRRSPRSPSIRVVDAFGRETVPEKEAPDESADVRRVEEAPGVGTPLGSGRSTPRSKSVVRVVDAMGREVDERSEVSSESSAPLSHNEALERVRELAAHLAADLSEVDRSCEDLAILDDQRRISALDDASRAARSARSKISRSMQLVKNAEIDPSSRYGALRASMRRSRFLPTSIVERQFSWNLLTSWSFWFLFISIQCAVWFIMHRISVTRAKSMFLTTYYDPYYPDLYLYVDKPDTLYTSIPTSSCRSAYHTSDAIAPIGWTDLVADMWSQTMCSVSQWQNQQWAAWSANHPQRRGALSWPPT